MTTKEHSRVLQDMFNYLIKGWTAKQIEKDEVNEVIFSTIKFTKKGEKPVEVCLTVKRTPNNV